MSALLDLIEDKYALDEIPLSLESFENDYVQSDDICLEICKCENALEQLFSIEKRVEDQYCILSDMSFTSIKPTTNYIAIKNTINSIISPTQLTYEIPSLESIGWYMSDSDHTVSLEGVGDVLRKIRDFIVKMFNRLIDAVNKFFDWVKGLFSKTKKNNETVKKKTEKKLEIAKKMPETKPTQTLSEEQIQKERGEKIQRSEKRQEKIKAIRSRDGNKEVTEKDVAEAIKEDEPLNGPIFKFGNLLPEGIEANVGALNNRLVKTTALLEGIFKSVPIWKTKGYLDLHNIILRLTSGFIKDMGMNGAITFCDTIINSSEKAFKEQYNSFGVQPDNTVNKTDLLVNIFDQLIGDKIITYAHGNIKWVSNLQPHMFIEKTKKYVNSVLNECGFGIEDNKNFKPSNPVRYSKSDFIALLTNTIIFCDNIDKIDFESYIKHSDRVLKEARNKYMKLKETKEEVLNESTKDYKITIMQISSQCDYKIHLAGINNQLTVIRLLLTLVNTFHKTIVQSEDSEFEEFHKKIVSNEAIEF